MQESENDRSFEEEIDLLESSPMDPDLKPDLFSPYPKQSLILSKSKDLPENIIKLTDWAGICHQGIKEGNFDLAHCSNVLKQLRLQCAPDKPFLVILIRTPWNLSRIIRHKLC